MLVGGRAAVGVGGTVVSILVLQGALLVGVCGVCIVYMFSAVGCYGRDGGLLLLRVILCHVQGGTVGFRERGRVRDGCFYTGDGNGLGC